MMIPWAPIFKNAKRAHATSLRWLTITTIQTLSAKAKNSLSTETAKNMTDKERLEIHPLYTLREKSALIILLIHSFSFLRERRNQTETEKLTTVVWGGQGAESFLASCVPNLKLYHVIVMLDCLEFEINSDCVENVLIEGVFGVS